MDPGEDQAEMMTADGDKIDGVDNHESSDPSDDNCGGESYLDAGILCSIF